MSNTSAQLETIFQEITEHFANIPQITVTPEEGNPPEQYRVTYHINGVCKEAGGEVTPCDTHIVTISLPFGFPHFPPNCRPESPLFHPDFDSSAICIGDVWETDKSIVKLISYIGKLISGETYSTVNAFNEEAAKWYQANSDKLPFDSSFDANAPGSTVAEPEPEPEPALSAEPDPVVSDIPEDDGEISMLDDDIFGDSFTLESTEPVIPEPLPDETRGVDTDRLRIMAKQKRFQALSRELAKVHDSFEGREEMEAQVQNAINEAMELFDEAEVLEHQGEQQQAMEKFLAVEGVVSDYPLLQEAKDRVKQSLDLLGDWVTKTSNATSAENPEGEETAPDKKSGKRTFFEEKKAVGKKWLLYTIGAGAVALCATLVVSYSSLKSGLQDAEASYTECSTLLEAWKFEAAEQKCSNALDILASVRIVKQDEKKELVQKIQTLLNSKTLKEGLKGNTLLDGKYVSQINRDLILAFKEAKENGDKFFVRETWKEAVLAYEKALDITTKTDAIDTALIADIREKYPQARFNYLMEAGEKSLSIDDWDDASRQFSEALKLAKADPNVPLEDIVQLELLSNQTTFNTLRDQGHAAFAKKEWVTALDFYQRALKLVQKMDLQETDTITGLHENIAKTKIYMTIEKGKKAFSEANWDDAIKQYAQATILLEENSKLLSQINTTDSREKLSRIMLHASIIRDKQDIAKFLKSEEYEPALVKLRDIQKSISESSFAELPEFATISKEAAEQISDAEKELQVIKQTAYLTDNFEELFLKHYPAAKRSKLSTPKVEYLKKIGDSLLFRMQCTETAGGRPLRLQMDYLYSPANDSWLFYTEEK